MNAIKFVTRTRAGILERGEVNGDDKGFLIDASDGQEVSLNISQSDVRGYDRAANDLLITLADGRVVVLENYFDGGDAAGKLYLSAYGTLNEVTFVEAEGGALFAQYGPTEEWGKWSPTDALIFIDEPTVVAEAPVPVNEGNEVSMLAAGLIGMGGLGAAGLGAAALGGAALLGGGDSGSGGGGGGGLVWTAPTVDDPDANYAIDGGDTPSLTITGTANPGSIIEITIGGITVTGKADDNGIWKIVFDGENFPPDGSYADIPVKVTDPDGTVTLLDGPSFVIDTTPPPVDVTDGTVSTGDLVNDDDHQDGVTVTGEGEPGATITITVDGTTQTTVVDENGNWFFDFSSAIFPPGTYGKDITLVATDDFGNSTTVYDVVQVDTENTIRLTNLPLTGDNVISGGEAAAGVTFTGMTDAGSTVTVTIDGVTHSATADADGVWNVTFAEGDLATGTYAATAQIVSTDSAGNVVTMSHDFDVDTETAVTVNTSTIAVDGIVNSTEHAGMIAFTGTGEPGATVTLELYGETASAVVGADGSWSMPFLASVLPTNVGQAGSIAVVATVTLTDPAGNMAFASGGFEIDVTNHVKVYTASVEGEGVVNAAERSDGVTLTGTAEPGSTVMVTLGTVTHQATVNADGSWTADFAAAEIPAGERTMDVTAISTDPAGNTATANGSIDVDTLVRNFAITSTPGGADAVINADEAAQGLVLTGTTEPGGSVHITLNGHTVQATVDAGGNWTASFDPAQLPSGEQTVTLTAVSIDPAGNTETITRPVIIDTDAGTLTISPDPVEGDDVVNLVEASDGVTIKGTSDPGQVVNVTLNGVTHAVLTDPSGNWSLDFAPGEIAPGTYTADISATITDSAGNTLTRTDSVLVDTEVLNFAASGTPVEGDNVINADEASDGFVLTGTTEPGSTVSVTFEGVTRVATVDASGNWSVGFQAGDIPAGEKATSAVIDTTDAAGNTATTSVDFDIDTEVNLLAMSSDPVTPDGVINAAEARQGVTLTGVVEQGSSVTVTVGGMAHVATVDASGNWSVDIPSSAIPTGTLSAPVLVEAVDAAGNTRAITETLSVDTDAPDTLNWIGYGRDGSGVDLIRTEITEDDVFLGQLSDPSGTPDVTAVAIDTSTDVEAIGQTYIDLDGSVADGTHLVLASTDAAGNTSGSYLVTDDPLTNTVLMSDDIAEALSDFQIDTIDLHFAEDSNLTITEAQIKALSENSDTVTIRGGSDDSVTITGATAEGNDGNGFNVFSLGDATLLIEDDITQIHGVT